MRFLQARRELEAVRRHHPVIVIRRGDQRRRVAHARFQVVVGRVPGERGKLLGVVGDP